MNTNQNLEFTGLVMDTTEGLHLNTGQGVVDLRDTSGHI